MGDISTNKYYSDDVVRGETEGRKDKGRRGREGRLRERLTGEKKSVLICVRDCVVGI